MSRTQSPIQMPTNAASGPHVELYWDEQIVERHTDEGVETYYDYAYCRAPRATNYGTLVSAIIRSQYSAEAELAAINNGGGPYDAYQALRQTAKVLAREYLDLPPMTPGELAEEEARQQRVEASREYAPSNLAPALKVLAEKLLTTDIANETLPEQSAQAVTLLFPKWEGNGVAYDPQRVLQHDGHLYEVMQAHTSQADWAPDVATTLFRRRYAPTGGIPDWQAWDGHNDSLYQIGSEVMYSGQHWISTAPDNHWVPGQYGWSLA